jgi:nitrate/TMAO reductase-like tetraheme cytochrome c subunit
MEFSNRFKIEEVWPTELIAKKPDVRGKTLFDVPFKNGEVDKCWRTWRRKMQASKDVWGKLFGTINTREKFLDHRLELAIHEWSRMKTNDSLECRNCHSAQSMDITRQSPRAVDSHQRFLFTGQKTCIDCHKGIAHQLPDMRNVPGRQ